MNSTLMGLETEYAFTAYDHDGNALDRTVYSDRLVTPASRRYASLYGRDKQDLFLANGSRLYVDSGLGLINLEYSTPECTRPEELIAHLRAGDRILAGLARDLEHSHPELDRAFISKTNFDYSGQTSGSHENYLHHAPQARLAPQLIPHLVSRIIYSGGGGFNGATPNIEFMLSPRVLFLEHVISPGSQIERAIFTTRNEPLSNSPYGRLHLLCGEGVRYDMSEYLRFGVTALIIRLVDSGLSPARGIELEPLPAINTVARDLRCRDKIGHINGVPASAIDVQRHYLNQVKSRLGQSRLPDWAETLCNRWEATLAGLESDPMQLAGILDWPTKLGLYRSFVEEKGFDWQRLTHPENKAQSKIRARLFEFDVRFGDIADDGLFTTLENHGRPENKIVTDIAIEDAMRIPPQNSRARLRGKWIKQLSRKRRDKTCNWGHIFDHKASRSLRFDDPFGVADVAWANDDDARSSLPPIPII